MGLLDFLRVRKPTRSNIKKTNVPSVFQDAHELASELQDVEELSNNLGLNQEKTPLQVNVLDNPRPDIPTSKSSTPGAVALDSLNSIIQKAQRKQTIKDAILNIFRSN